MTAVIGVEGHLKKGQFRSGGVFRGHRTGLASQICHLNWSPDRGPASLSLRLLSLDMEE